MGSSAFPALATVRDPDRMRAVLQAALRHVDGSPVEVVACDLNYVRQAPASCVLQYTVTLHDPVSGSTRDQVVTGVISGNAEERFAATKLQSVPRVVAIGNGPLSLVPYVYVPELSLLVQVFPCDHRLPGLSALVQGWPAFEAALLDEFGPGDWHISARGHEIVRYRPTMRAMVRLEVQAREAATGRTEVRRAYAKVYADDAPGQQGYRLLWALWERTTATDAGFAVARPMAYDAEIRTLLQSELPGKRLLEILRRADPEDATDAVRRAARAVAGLHQLSLPEGLLPFARWDLRTRLASLTSTLSEKFPAYATAIDTLATSITAGLGVPPLAPTHFDLKPGNILVDGRRVSLLDFDKLALGDPLIDVANIVANLGTEEAGGRRRSSRCTVPASVFLEEYFAHVPASWRDLFPARYALATIGEADIGRGMRGRPARADRAARIAAAITLAQGILAGQL